MINKPTEVKISSKLCPDFVRKKLIVNFKRHLTWNCTKYAENIVNFNISIVKILSKCFGSTNQKSYRKYEGQ